MRHVMLALITALVLSSWVRGASAAPFEPGTIPDQIEAVGHLDADALRKTQLFAAVGGQAAIDAAIDDALDTTQPELRPLARSLARSIRGLSFWKDGERGALYVETRDGRTLAQAVAKLPVKPERTIEGVATYTLADTKHSRHAHHPHLAVYGDTLVLAETGESLARSLKVLAGKGASLAGSSKLPLSSRQGVFMFVTIGTDMLNAIQKSAHSKVLQLALKSVAIDAGEVAGMITANARAEMRSADAVQKAKSILDGLRALASLSDAPHARALHDAVVVTTNGLAIEITAKLPVSEIAKAIQAHK